MKLFDLRQQRLKRQLYYVALGSFILVVIWIGFEIFWAYQRTEKIEVKQANLEPIESDLYTDLALSLSNRRVFSESELNQYLRGHATLAAPVPSPTPIIEDSSPSASTIILPPQIIPESSDSGAVNQ